MSWKWFCGVYLLDMVYIFKPYSVRDCIFHAVHPF
jgi:hypothetical protein